MNCRHITKFRWSPAHMFEHRRCVDCGKWFGLGPASDTPDVLVEIRAAELAAAAAGALATFTSAGFDGAEHAGWLEAKYDSAKDPEQPGEWSGWLAREIWSTP